MSASRKKEKMGALDLLTQNMQKEAFYTNRLFMLWNLENLTYKSSLDTDLQSSPHKGKGVEELAWNGSPSPNTKSFGGSKVWGHITKA